MRLILLALSLTALFSVTVFAEPETKALECSSSKFQINLGSSEELYFKLKYAFLPLYRVCAPVVNARYSPSAICYLDTHPASSASVATGSTTLAAVSMKATIGSSTVNYVVNDRGDGIRKHTYDFSGNGTQGQLKVTNKFITGSSGEKLYLATVESGKGKQKTIVPMFCR